RPSENVKRRFWNVILVSALSESLENISFQHAAKVFVDGFLANNRGWEIWIPSVSLGELYDSVPPAEIVGQEGSLRLLTGVEKILEGSDGTIRAVKTRQGEELEADQFVLAVPWYRLPELLPARLQLKYASVKEIQPAPISSVHLWFDRPVTELPHAVFVDHLSQWIFARPAKANRIDGNDTSYYQIVISESRALGKVSKDEVIDRVLEEIRSVFPRARAAQLVHSRLVTEHKAVFSPRPGIESLRPSQTTPVENLHLAGDWTDTGWPATMEGAVRSGFLAAESVLAALGIDHQILQPSLPATWLARRLFGLPKS
ncbi:MAG TPA: FAD-dependent oxidoreductase, partial [Planctomycetaceae bacterium]|nr:FAD-dependent oxidoreductase [Planctomycetaceae bacterium]